MNKNDEFVRDILEVFEEFLSEKRIEISNEEKAQSEDPAVLYGTDYGNLQESLLELIQNWNIQI